MPVPSTSAGTALQGKVSGLRYGSGAIRADTAARWNTEEYAKLDLLKFENFKDSVEEPEVTPPHELVQLMMQFMAANQPANGAGAAA